MKMLVSTFALHVIIALAVNAILHLNDDQIFNRKRRNKDDDCHDHDRLDENEAIDANV
jgi:hypothetical protein